MSQSFYTRFILITLISLAVAQNPRGNLNLSTEQDRLRCLGVQCPPERPRCITMSQITKCVPLEPLRRISPKKNNRLSRPAPGIGSSLDQPPVVTSIFKLNEREKSLAKRNLTELPSIADSPQSSKPTPNPSEGGVPSFCYQRYETGVCRGYFPRFYYNPRTGTCRRFIFGGCGGNRNNFNSEQECKSVCVEPIQKTKSGFDVGLDANAGNGINTPGNNNIASNVPTNGFAKGAPPPPPAYCSEVAERGPCFAAMPRVYYNKDTKECRTFLYGGCGGNRNNFQSMTSCKRACDYYDFYTSRQSNGNNIPQGPAADVLPSEIPHTDPVQETTVKPMQNQRPDICFLPKNIGPCRALIPRFFFNFESKRCEQFGFGGCQANANNFRSERECKKECMTPKSIGVKPISRPAINNNEMNSLLAGQLRRSNNNEMNSLLGARLQQFNPVDSAAFREFLISQQIHNDVDIIGPSSPGFYVCTQPLDPGTCTLEIRNYYFNARTRSCQPFLFHGCGGNQNRFTSLASCQDTCMRRDSPRQISP